MTVVYRASVPIYEAECDECHSVIRYQKAETRGNQGYINCPVCGVPICALTVNPVIVLDDEEQKKRNTTNADRIRAMTDEELAAYLGHASLCVTIQGEDGGAWCSQYGDCNECVREWLRQEADT